MRMLAPVLCALLVAGAALAAPPEPGDAAAPLAPEDAAGRALAVPAPGHVMLLSFASPSTGEAAGEIARAIRVEHPALEILSFIDLSSFPRLLRSFARREIVKRQESAVKATRAAFARAGKTAPDDLAARIHVIPDFDAESGKAYGVGETGNRPVMVLIGADGLVKAIFESPSFAEVEAAVAREAGSQPPR
jgi:hypothetical protein